MLSIAQPAPARPMAMAQGLSAAIVGVLAALTIAASDVLWPAFGPRMGRVALHQNRLRGPAAGVSAPKPQRL
jgi:hypothetical protein